ncbi:class I SAM-dependent methyltransferase [Candidatus Nitrospira neomarina]|uniref:Methyltransferase domain-containing protein n=1 Tax=Candidatus Nitrospira neomarina TaxID=3020899 RepID=A0AA96GLK4_9BACT|nr:methyltransferase domain-containing protein [Candidatus Nitrospira neomarina]WNM61353.1 methyltransferase domain-containing protein [Candidatus Nitrospira neomarina]
MTTDYNQIAKQYKEGKEQPWRSRLELFSMMNLIGDLTGKSVIDVACGEGWLTRELRKAGAAEVVGVDISEEMIGLARWQEAREPLGIEYRVEDARATESAQQFDISVSNWLLVYAHDREELGVMCRGLARRIRSGGRFVTLIVNPDLYSMQAHPPDYGKYGFQVRLHDSVYEGAPLVWTILLDDSSIEIENYYMPIEVYESALHDAGFREVTFHKLTLAPIPQTSEEGDYWEDILRCPPGIMIDGIKA